MSKSTKTKANFNYMIIPIMVLMFIPTILRIYAIPSRLTEFPWFYKEYTSVDMYVWGKVVFLYVTSGIMAMMLLFAYMNNMIPRDRIVLFDDKKKLFAKWYVLIVIAFILAFASTLFSKYRAYGFGVGVICSYENIYTLLCYSFIPIYIYLFVISEKDIYTLQWPLLISQYIVIGVGVAQHLDHHVCTIPGFNEFITASKYIGQLTYKNIFSTDQIESTLMNSNFVGVFSALLLPIACSLFAGNKHIIAKLLWFIDIVGLFYIAHYSQSETFIVAMLVELIVLAIFAFFKLLQSSKFVATLIILIMICLCIIASNLLNDRLSEYIHSLKATTENNLLKDLSFDNEGMHVSYKDLTFTIGYEIKNGKVLFYMYDDDKKEIEININENGRFEITNERYSFFLLSFNQTNPLRDTDVPYVASLLIDDPDLQHYVNEVRTILFYKDPINHCYYYVTPGLRLGTDINKAPVWIFNDKLNIISNRGYIWGATLPLLPRYILLGSGAESFAAVFPNYDYVTKLNAGATLDYCTKPHNWYMQIWVQQGGLSFLCQMVVILIYLINSFKIYYSHPCKCFLSKTGLGITVGIIGYLITMITCDSCPVTAPLFWILLGIGFSINKIIENHLS